MNHFLTSCLLCALLSVWVQTAPAQTARAYPDSLNKKRLYTVAGIGTAAYTGGISYLGFIWYSDKKRVPFHFYDDSKAYLQADKAGHAFTAYHQSRLSYEALRWAGLDKKRALLYGAPMGLIFQTPIEVFDGLYEGWGFSWWDMAANAAGPALFAVQEAIWDEQVVTMKFSYSPSGYPRYHSLLGDNEWESFLLDYNGHSYWLSANVRSITGSRRLPPWFNLALGYSIEGVIGEFENPRFYRGQPFPHLERYRQWVISPDIDFTRIPTQKPWLRSLFRYANMIKLPFPALEYNRVEGLRLRALYF